MTNQSHLNYQTVNYVLNLNNVWRWRFTVVSDNSHHIILFTSGGAPSHGCSKFTCNLENFNVCQLLYARRSKRTYTSGRWIAKKRKVLDQPLVKFWTYKNCFCIKQNVHILGYEEKDNNLSSHENVQKHFEYYITAFRT